MDCFLKLRASDQEYCLCHCSKKRPIRIRFVLVEKCTWSRCWSSTIGQWSIICVFASTGNWLIMLKSFIFFGKWTVMFFVYCWKGQLILLFLFMWLPKGHTVLLLLGNQLNSDIINMYWTIDPKATSLPTLSVRHGSFVFTDIMSVICIMRILTIILVWFSRWPIQFVKLLEIAVIRMTLLKYE